MHYQDRLDEAEVRYNQLTALMTDPAVINDGEQYRKIAKAESELTELVSKYRQWKKAEQELREARVMLTESDSELHQMAQAEIVRLEPELAAIEQDLEVLLLPKDPNDEKDVVGRHDQS